MKKIYFIWAIFGSLILLFAGMTENDPSALGQGFAYLFFLFIIWRILKKETTISLKYSLGMSFILIGWFFAMVDEVVFFPTNPLYEGVSLLGDLILTTPVYLLAHYFWLRLNKKYSFSWFEALLIGGFGLLLGEEFWTGIIISSGFLGLVLLPALILIHGFHMIMPVYLLRNDLKKLKRKKTKWKYFWAVLVLPISFIIGGFLVEVGKSMGIT